MPEREAIPGSKFAHGVIEVDGARLQYAQAGSGTAVVSIPGSAGLEMSLAKDMLANDYRVVELNAPGWGLDDEVEGVQEMKPTAALLAEAAVALGLDRYHLIGTSAGAIFACWIATLYPDRVLSVTSEGGETVTRPQDRHGFDQTQMDRMAEVMRGEATWGDSDAKLWPAPAYGRKWWADADYHAALMRRRWKMFKHIRNSDNDELLAALPKVSVPVLALVGDGDEIMQTSVLEAWEAAMPQSIRVVVPGGMHDIQNTQPEAMIALMRQHVL